MLTIDLELLDIWTLYKSCRKDALAKDAFWFVAFQKLKRTQSKSDVFEEKDVYTKVWSENVLKKKIQDNKKW